MGGIGAKKYRAIVLSIALFVVFDAGVLIMNFYIADQFARDALQVNLAGRQSTLAQRLLKALLQTDNALGSGNVVDGPLDELKSSYRTFDETLGAFNGGGTVMGADGEPALLEAIRDPHGRHLLTQIFDAWLPLKSALQPLLAFDSRIERSAELIMTEEGADLESDLFHAIMVATKDNRDGQLHDRTNDLAVYMEYEASRRAGLLRIIQVTGICLALINFFVILLHFIRNLNKYDEIIEAARKETGEILETVNEGLFLLDADCRIGSQYSAALTRIFRRNDLAGVNFIDLLRDIVPETTLKVAHDYISLFFRKRVNPNLVDDLNPLSQVEVHFGGDDSNQFHNRFLAFEFRRVLVDEALSHLLVTVVDITDRVALQRELAESRTRSAEQLDMLMDILHIEPEMLTDFLCASERALGKINSVLRRPLRGADVYAAKLDQIFREVHKVKGDAAALGLKSVQSHAHELEDHIAAIRERASIGGSDFLPLTIKLDELLGHVNSVRDLVARLVDFRSAFQRSRTHDDDELRGMPRTGLTGLLYNLAERLAADHGKRVTLDCVGLDGRHIPAIYRGPIRDMAVQFVRNGVTHGIEAPDARLAANKGQNGRIAMKFVSLGPTGFEFSYRDDGCGLDMELIRETAVAKGFVSADQIGAMNDKAVMALIFQRGFTTSSIVSSDAGRGVGMDIVRNLVNELEGRVRVSTAPGQFTQFRITLPAVPSDLDQAA